MAKMARGRVVKGQVEFEGGTTLPNGTEVENRPFELTEEEEEELWQARVAISRGDGIPFDQILAKLRSSYAARTTR
jgi:hypothetical protein